MEYAKEQADVEHRVVTTPPLSDVKLADAKTTANGVVLVPQPTDDPRDPLNWPQRKKYLILSILCLAGFASNVSALANQLALGTQAKVYHKTLVETSYAVSAAIAGVAAGPLLLVPLAQMFGKSSVIFWTLLATVGCGIWSALMTHRDQYNAFVVARLFSGLFGSVPTILGSGAIMDIFFLHERGLAFTTLAISFLLGTVAGPTFGGFVVQSSPWPIVFWWTVGLQALVAILVFCFLEETGFTRDSLRVYPVLPHSFIPNRIYTFFPGTRVVPRVSVSHVAWYAATPFLIGVSPVGFLICFYQFIFFGWFVMVNTLLAVFLQEPPKHGGYGFSPLQTAAFSFSLWFGVILAQVYGALINDRLPLWICRRRGGIWKPEYRLHCLWVPAVLVPTGLGIFGACVEHHYHYMVLAVGAFLLTFGAMLCVPVSINYVAECFTHHAQESSNIMALFRLSLGLAVPFFVDPWEAKVGVGWVFGMAAFFSILGSCLIALLVWKGEKIRKWSFKSVASDEGGARVTKGMAL
ncbi:Major facilitator superfamily domain, general substrate transporter [Lasallia pustulata]|uniref:Major facilitator superfamily domain, general substrate transporter n=1 Tax=Lasallia pustulata TaxID=136370 RepID=A0A1W5DE54_9LECA|nr:Major facilitator superfamily domain, general substrate transporter [Lasallia pustulata]